MNQDLTSNPRSTELQETTVMGRTVYVSERSGDAYVEFQDELVSMTNLRAWNYLMEKAKQDVIDSYEKEETLQEKEVKREADSIATDLQGMAQELYAEADKLKRKARTTDTDKEI